MKGMGANPSPLEELRIVVMANSDGSEVKWASERDMEFFKGALEAMERRAKELDGECFFFFAFGGVFGEERMRLTWLYRT